MRLGQLDLADLALVGHLPEDALALVLGLAGIAPGVVQARRRDEAGEHGGLGEVHVADRLAEVRLGRGGDAVGPAPEVGAGEVAVEDVVLAQRLLDPAGQDGLPELAARRPLVAGIEEADVLLGDRRPALDVATTPDVGPQGPEDAPGVHAVVLIEPLVLDGQDGVDQHGRDVAPVQRQAGLEAPVVGDLGTRGVEHPGDAGLDRRPLGRERATERHGQQGHGEDADDQDGDEQAGHGQGDDAPEHGVVPDRRR